MNLFALANFVYGAIAALCWVVALFFVSFWRRTHDRFFALFGVAFALLGLGRLALSLVGGTVEVNGSIYLVRLLAYLVFLGAIIDKNRLKGDRPPSASGGPRDPPRR